MTQFQNKSFNVGNAGACFKKCARRGREYPNGCECCKVQGKNINYVPLDEGKNHGAVV